jgi:hypothetical protein
VLAVATVVDNELALVVTADRSRQRRRGEPEADSDGAGRPERPPSAVADQFSFQSVSGSSRTAEAIAT